MIRPRPFFLVLALGASLLVPMSARADVVSASCYVAYRLAENETLTNLWVPFNLVGANTISASIGAPFTPIAMKSACLQLFKDSALFDCVSGPGVDEGLVSAQVYLTTVDSDIGARSKALINDVRGGRTAAKVTWRKCSTLQSP